MTLDAFLAGRTAGTVNTAMAHDLPIGPVLSAAGGVWRWRVFGSGGPQVSVGCDDWLYLTEELRPWPGAEAAMQARVAGLRRVSAGLTAQGVALLIAVVPDKARIQTATACGVPYSAQSRARFAAFTALLDGLKVVNLDAVFAAEKRRLFYPHRHALEPGGRRPGRARHRRPGHDAADPRPHLSHRRRPRGDGSGRRPAAPDEPGERAGPGGQAAPIAGPSAHRDDRGDLRSGRHGRPAGRCAGAGSGADRQFVLGQRELPRPAAGGAAGASGPSSPRRAVRSGARRGTISAARPSARRRRSW